MRREDKKLLQKSAAKSFKRTNILAGICQGKWVDPLQYEGTTDNLLFEYWFEYCLLKEINPGSVVMPQKS